MTLSEPVAVCAWSDLPDRVPRGVLVAGVDLVVVRLGDEVSVLYGRCLHRGALLADGHVQGEDLVCGLHGWDYRVRSGVSAYANDEVLATFASRVVDGHVEVDRAEVAAWAVEHPQPYDRDTYQGAYADPHGTPDEPHTGHIHQLARDGLSKVGHHGPVAAMGVPRSQLPSWDELQFVTAQLHRLPLLDDEPVDTGWVLGPSAARPLAFDIPLFVSDMSFGALSEEAKVALSTGADQAGTGICSGEGGMLPEEQGANRRYLYELASGRFGWRPELVERVQAFHLKLGQGAKTGTGGHLPGDKVRGRIAEVRGLEPGTPAVSPARFVDLTTPADFRRVFDEVRERSGGIPCGVKMSAQHIELDLDAALALGVDYVILDGRGGGTGAAPRLFRDHISVPTMAALARARRHLDRRGAEVSLVVTGGLRTEADFLKAMALGADGVAIANSALQAIGCLGMRACHTNNCPVGIATQKPGLRRRLEIAKSAEQLSRYLGATVELMQVMARACGHRSLSAMSADDLTTWHREVAGLTGVTYGGVLLRP